MSMLIIALAAALLGGAAFAWFTDSEQAGAKFTAGTLDVNLATGIQSFEFTSGVMAPGDVLAPVEVTITNAGSLDMFYKFGFVKTGADPQNKLDEVLLVTINDGAGVFEGQANIPLNLLGEVFNSASMELAPGASEVLEFTFSLPEGTGNDYQAAFYEGNFVVSATQVANNLTPAWD